MENILFFKTQLIQAISSLENGYPKLSTIKSGETISCPEKFQQNLYFSLNGVVKISKIHQTEKEIVITLLPEKSLFGLLSLLSNQSAQLYHAIAFTPVKLISLPSFQFQQELKKSPELSRLITQKLLSRLLTDEMIIESQLQKKLEVRLISFLLMLGRNFGVKTDSGLKINLQLSHKALAELINSSRVSVTRILGQLRQQQMISIKQQKIILHNPSALSQHVDLAIPYL